MQSKLKGTIVKFIFKNFNSTGYNQKIVIRTKKGNEYKVLGRFPPLMIGETIEVTVTQSETSPDEFIATQFHFVYSYTFDNFLHMLSKFKLLKSSELRDFKSIINTKLNNGEIHYEENTLFYFLDIFNKYANVSEDTRSKVNKHISVMQLVHELFGIFGNKLDLKEIYNIATAVYNSNKIELVKEDYYNIAYIYPTINIKRLDEWCKSAFEIDNKYENRVSAYIYWYMYKLATNYKIEIVTKEQIIRKIQQIAQVDPVTITHALLKLQNDGYISELSTNTFVLSEIKNKYEFISGFIKRKLSEDTVLTVDMLLDIERYLEHYNNISQIQLSDEQMNAIKTCFKHKVSIITGGAGTGKSTVIKLINNIAKSLELDPIILTPTGKSAYRLSDLKAKTIHFAIGWDGVNPNVKLRNKFIIIDEAGMVDLNIMYHLLNSIPVDSYIVMIGDPFQLQPIELGNVFKDFINSNIIPVSRLTKVYRNDSKIIDLAYSVLNKQVNNTLNILHEFMYSTEQNGQNELVVIKTTHDKILEFIKHSFMSAIIKASKTANLDLNLLALIPIKNAYVSKYNGTIINYYIDSTIRHNKLGYSVLICTENNYKYNIFNGVKCILIEKDTQNKSNTDYVIKLPDENRNIEVSEFEYISNFELGYVLTVHKAQGSEYDVVILPLLSDHIQYWDINLLYTAITRTKKKLIILADMQLDETIFSILTKRDNKNVSLLIQMLTTEVDNYAH